MRFFFLILLLSITEVESLEYLSLQCTLARRVRKLFTIFFFNLLNIFKVTLTKAKGYKMPCYCNFIDFVKVHLNNVMDFAFFIYLFIFLIDTCAKQTIWLLEYCIYLGVQRASATHAFPTKITSKDSTGRKTGSTLCSEASTGSKSHCPRGTFSEDRPNC